MANTMRGCTLIKAIAGAIGAWQLAVTDQFDITARAVDAVTAPRAVVVRSSLGACNGAVLASDLVLTAAHCIVGAVNVRIAGLIDNTLYSLADVSATEPHPQYVATPGDVPLAGPDMAL